MNKYILALICLFIWIIKQTSLNTNPLGGSIIEMIKNTPDSSISQEYLQDNKGC